MNTDSDIHPLLKLEQCGGKAFNLQKLRTENFPVPPFAVLTTHFLSRVSSGHEGRETLSTELSRIHNEINSSLYAVRSSAVEEDTQAFSFAGQFATRLNLKPEELEDAVLEVLNSANNEMIQAYLKFTGKASIKMAVIVQAMVPATEAGVGFSKDPSGSDSSGSVINCIKGNGEALVNGSVNADHYSISNGLIEKNTTTPGEQVLSDQQILKVDAVMKKLETVFKAPQDVEFAFVNEGFFLLQSRPITTLGNRDRITWDNSNIVESYPGLTLPLTFSFIEKMYEAVYRQFSQVLGVSEKAVNDNSTVYANMLGLLNGRVYYNLNSWYQALAQLPGYSVNAEFMEKMMGVKESFPYKPPVQRISKWKAFRQVGVAVCSILKNLFTLRSQKKKFIRDFDHIYQQFDRKDYSQAGISEVWNNYRQFEELMVSKWKAPLVNDFFAMIYFGLLQKQCAKYFPERPNLHNQLVAASKDIITTEPMRRLPELATAVRDDAALRTLFDQDDQDFVRIWEELKTPEFSSFLKMLESYLNDWGERCVAELKLETVTYQQEPAKLISIVKAYLAEGIFHYESSPAVATERVGAEKVIRSAIRNPAKRSLFNYTLKKARYLISNRENLRYYRTKGFGLVRRLMTEIGQKMADMYLLDNARDVFYLRLAEIENVAHDQQNVNFRNVVNNRKKDYCLYATMELPERISTYGRQTTILTAAVASNQLENRTDFQGIPCSSGVVKARVRLVRSLDDCTSVQQQIMATYATDPGWVVLFPSARGILTERGSLLSHAAIVSREMGIPCIVGIEGLMQHLHDGDEIIMDGSTGVLKIINRVGPDE